MKFSFTFMLLMIPATNNIQAINDIMDSLWNSKANPVSIYNSFSRQMRMYKQGTKTIDDFKNDAKKSCKHVIDGTKKGAHTLKKIADNKIYDTKKAIQNNEILYEAANGTLITLIYGAHYTVRAYKAITGK